MCYVYLQTAASLKVSARFEETKSQCGKIWKTFLSMCRRKTEKLHEPQCWSSAQPVKKLASRIKCLCYWHCNCRVTVLRLLRAERFAQHEPTLTLAFMTGRVNCFTARLKLGQLQALNDDKKCLKVQLGDFGNLGSPAVVCRPQRAESQHINQSTAKNFLTYFLPFGRLFWLHDAKITGCWL